MFVKHRLGVGSGTEFNLVDKLTIETFSSNILISALNYIEMLLKLY
jgi:hypothetical protein